MLRRHMNAHALRRALSTSAAQSNPRAATATVGRTVRATTQESTARRVYAFAFGVGGVTLGLVGYKLMPRTELGKSELGKTETLELAPERSIGLIPYDEVQKHNSRESCWVVVGGEVYDVTGFLQDHPGGIAPILKVAGTDATRVFVPIHPPGTLSTLPPGAHLGTVDPDTVPKLATMLTEEEIRIQRARAALPHPDAAINLADIEKLAKTVLNQTAWAYYRSAGDDEFSV
jgi:L-lactate dehydrogenase (cytochrome)